MEKSIAKINGVEIIADREKKLVPIKPICEALGIDYSTQFQKLKDDEFLSSVVVLSPATGADGKTHKMVCLPAEFVYGWLFTINPKNVKEDARETVIRHKRECYNVLHNAQLNFEL